MPTFSFLALNIESVGHYLQILLLAAALGAALGVVRPVRREIVPRSAHVIQAQILLAIVGALIIVVVAESLSRAFAIVGAAGLVRYRAPIKDPKDAGVMLVALAVGLTVGSGMYLLAIVACAFVMAVLWLLESLEPATGARFELTVGGRDAVKLQPDIEQVLGEKGVSFELLGSSSHELHLVTVPFTQGSPAGQADQKPRGADWKHRRVGHQEVQNGEAVSDPCSHPGGCTSPRWR